MLRPVLNFFVLLFLINILSCKTQKSVHSDPGLPIDLYDSIKFEIEPIKIPVFQDYEVSVADFGAIGNGITLNTESINKAIIYISEKGGGKVTIPNGIWLTGPIELKSNVNLHLETGALLLFSKDFDQYPIIATSFEGLETFRCKSPISAKKVENIAITGNGIIDGSGDAWRPVKKNKLTEQQWKNLIKSGGIVDEERKIWYPSEKSMKGAKSTSNFNVPEGLNTIDQMESVKDFLRPVMVSLIESKNVFLDGITFQNSPSWNIHPLMCENLIIRNITVRNPWYAQNGDGIDLESCKNAIIYKCTFDVGDDGICIKSGKDENGRKRGKPTENIIIRDCVVFHGHGGFVVGSEMSGGVRNIDVRNCTFLGTDVGLRFKSTRGRGGVVENIYISEINMINIPTEAISFNLYYSGSSPIPEPDDSLSTSVQQPEFVEVSEKTPEFRNINIRNVHCNGAARAIKMTGLPEMKLNNFVFENITIKSVEGIECTDARNIVFKNIKIETEKYPVIILAGSDSIKFDSFSFLGSDDIVVDIQDNKCSNITFSNTSFTNTARQVKIDARVSKEIIKINL